jgi:hypothetical protein
VVLGLRLRRGAGKGQDGYFGNEVAVGKQCPECGQVHTTGGSTPACYEKRARRRIKNDIQFAARLKFLRGKTLACFCAPGPCHGDVLEKLCIELNTLE